MLVLSRRVQESIVIGNGKDKIIIKVLNTHGRQIKLGIDAPSNVTIHREEVYLRTQEGQKDGDNDREAA